MAKELPYFKFEPNAWENGNIQMLSREDKGLFIDICSMYWSRLGDIPLKLVIQKLCAGNATALNPLCDEKIIEVIDGNIFIKFLSEQLNEFEDVSKQNSKNAKEGWEKRRKQKEESERNATALKSQSENDAIREDKSKEEEIKEEKKIEDILLKKETKQNIIQRKEKFKNDLMPYKEKYESKMLNEFYSYWTEHGEKDKKMRFEKETSFAIERRLGTWKSNENKFVKNGNNQQQPIAGKPKFRSTLSKLAEKQHEQAEFYDSKGELFEDTEYTELDPG